MANGATWTYDSVRKHQVIEAGSTANEYAYDANGNMTSWMGNPITWTSYNYPSSITDAASGESVTFRYGPTRNPWLEAIQNASGTTETYRFGSLMDLVNSGSGIAYRNYIYAGTDPVAVDTINGSGENLEYFQTGAQGSIDAITNSSGQVLLNESFTAYGARRNPTTWSGAASSADLATSAGITQHGYTFQRALGEQMGLNDMVGRVEDAVIGRFMSADPTMPNPFDPQSFNPYSYTGNNPLTYTDPTGFRKKDNASSGKGGSSTGGGAGVDGGGGGNGGGGGALRPVVINGTQGVPSSGGGGGGVGAPTGISGPHLAPQSNPPKTTLQPVTVTATRLPDFAHISFSFPFENEFTGPFLGIGLTFTIDRYGDVYVSVNGVAGLPSAKGASGMAGWMNSSSTPSQSQLSGMLSSWGGGAQVGYGGLGLGFYGNSSGTSESGGLSSPGASVYGGYTWEVGSVSSWHW